MTSLKVVPVFSAVVGALLLATPMAGFPMADLEALNRELGRLCSSPPPEALSVCRIHARLIRAM